MELIPHVIDGRETESRDGARFPRTTGQRGVTVRG